MENLGLMGVLQRLVTYNPWADEEVAAVAVAGNNAADRAVAVVAVAGHTAADRAVVIRSKLVKVLIGVVVLLIVLPGIVFGVLIKESTAGIALSSAIIALANFFAGLYYYINKRD